MKIPAFTLIFVALGSVGCGTSTGNPLEDTSSPPVSAATPTTIGGLPAGTVSLSIVGTSAGTSAAGRAGRFIGPLATERLEANQISVNDAQGIEIGVLTLQDARVALNDINLKLAESELSGEHSSTKQEEDAKTKFKGPFVVDLLTNAVTPSLSPITLLAGTYDRFEIKLDKIEEGDEGTLLESSDPLFGNSIYLAGTYTGQTASGGATDMPFTMSFELDEEFDLAAGAGGLSVEADALNPIVIAFRLVEWLAFDSEETNGDGVDFSRLTPVSGAISLDHDAEGDNSKIREVVIENIKASAKFGKDSDSDGELSVGEDLED